MTRIAAVQSVSFMERRNEELTAFTELESTIRLGSPKKDD